jgi:hypothetical protein
VTGVASGADVSAVTAVTAVSDEASATGVAGGTGVTRGTKGEDAFFRARARSFCGAPVAGESGAETLEDAVNSWLATFFVNFLVRFSFGGFGTTVSSVELFVGLFPASTSSPFSIISTCINMSITNV